MFRNRYRDGEVWEKDNPHMVDDILRFAAMSDLALLRELQELKKQNLAIWKATEGLRMFRTKIKHPVSTMVRSVSGKLGFEKRE